MSDLFDAAVKIVLADEGVLSNDASDPGGLTKYGISKKAYPTLDIASLTVPQALHIYDWDYWRPCGCDDLGWRWALPVFDCAVNQGPATARGFLQSALSLHVDGVIGPQTIGAAQRAGDELIDIFMALRAISYAHDSAFQQYGKGWLKRTYQIRRLAAMGVPNAVPA